VSWHFPKFSTSSQVDTPTSDSRISGSWSRRQFVWIARVNKYSLVFFHLLERRSNSSLGVWGRSLSIGLEDGSSSSEIFLGCLGGLSSSLVWVVWESWSIEPDSGWALTPWSLFEGDTLDGSDEEELKFGGSKVSQKL